MCTCSIVEYILFGELFPLFFLCRFTGPPHALLVHLYVLHEQKGSFRVIEGVATIG